MCINGYTTWLEFVYNFIISYMITYLPACCTTVVMVWEQAFCITTKPDDDDDDDDDYGIELKRQNPHCGSINGWMRLYHKYW